MTEENMQTMDTDFVGDADSIGAADFELFSTTNFKIEDTLTLRALVHSDESEKSRFAKMVEELPDPASTQSPEKIIRRGLGHWVLGQYLQAAECLQRQVKNPVAAYFRAKSLYSRGLAKEAKEAFESLLQADKGNNFAQTGYLLCFESLEDWDGLKKALKSSGKNYSETADYNYFEGRLAETEKQHEQAIAFYEQALEKDPNQRNATFRLAYLLDLFGMDGEAIAHYERLMAMNPVDANAAINLGLLYEDHERYDKACVCFEAVLTAYPNHQRARMFLEDARASMNMFYDEDQEKKEDKLQQILRIPITDFELSVRARNCLAKMEIQTLGDLVKKTETELLGFKNFGETSLNEIREILRQKGLNLGLGREDVGIGMNPLGTGMTPPSAEALQKPIADLDLSVRSRRTVDSLGILVFGDLTAKSEKDLLSTPNFGQTSLKEIKEKLARYGLTLRDSQD